MSSGYFDISELIKRIIKYLIEGFVIGIVAFVIPKKALNLDEIMLISIVAAATFGILDTYVPLVGVSARTGAGFGIGANLVGFPV